MDRCLRIVQDDTRHWQAKHSNTLIKCAYSQSNFCAENCAACQREEMEQKVLIVCHRGNSTFVIGELGKIGE